MKKKKVKEETKCNCKSGADCHCGEHGTCGDSCRCDSKKNNYLKVIGVGFVGMFLFLGGLIVGAVLLYKNDDVISEKCGEIKEKDNNIYRYQATSNVLNFRDITRNNNYKEGTYIVDYHHDFEGTKYAFSIEFKGKYGVDGDLITMRLEDKVVDYKCDYSCGDEIKLYINSDFGYIIVAHMTEFLPMGKIDIYDFSGNLVKSFDNVINTYYDCDDGLHQGKYIRTDVDYSASTFRFTTIYLAENYVAEDYDWPRNHWFDSLVSVYKLNLETLETNKISDFNACFSIQ